MMQARLRSLLGDSMGAMAAEVLRHAIYSGRFKPGDAVREMQLARQMRLSEATVREALVQLEHAGLVMRQPKRGARVTRLSDREVQERAAIRIVLETEAALQAAPRLTPGDFAWLENCRKEWVSAVARNAYYEAAQADLSFHRLIWQASGNQTLCRTLDRLTAPLFAFVSVRQSEMLQDLQKRVLSHDPIFEALRARKAAAIRAAIGDHLTGAYFRKRPE